LHALRHADAAWLRQAFEPRYDIHAVAEDVAVLDDNVAHIDPDPELDARLRWHITVPVGHAGLHFGRTVQRVDHATELDEEAVARRLDQPAVMCGDRRIDQLGQDRLESLEGTVLIRPDQARVPRHIGGEDCSQTAGAGHFVGESRPPEADIHGVLVKRPVLGSSPRLGCPVP